MSLTTNPTNPDDLTSRPTRPMLPFTPLPDPFPSTRPSTLRIRDLLTAKLSLVRIEFTGEGGGGLMRVGTLLCYAPLLLVGYLFVLAACACMLAVSFGVVPSLLALGAIHIVIGLMGLWRGRRLATSSIFPIVDPELDDVATGDPADHAITSPHTPATSFDAVRSKLPTKPATTFPPRSSTKP